MTTDEMTVQVVTRFACLYLAVELCKTANAFDRPEQVMNLARQFEGYCLHSAERKGDAKRG